MLQLYKYTEHTPGMRCGFCPGCTTATVLLPLLWSWGLLATVIHWFWPSYTMSCSHCRAVSPNNGPQRMHLSFNWAFFKFIYLVCGANKCSLPSPITFCVLLSLCCSPTQPYMWHPRPHTKRGHSRLTVQHGGQDPIQLWVRFCPGRTQHPHMYCVSWQWSAVGLPFAVL